MRLEIYLVRFGTFVCNTDTNIINIINNPQNVLTLSPMVHLRMHGTAIGNLIDCTYRRYCSVIDDLITRKVFS